jgi:hypothetical protein
MLDTNHLPDFAGCFRIRTHDPVVNSEWRVFRVLALATRGGSRYSVPSVLARACASKGRTAGQRRIFEPRRSRCRRDLQLDEVIIGLVLPRIPSRP